MTSAGNDYVTLATYLKHQNFGPAPLLPHPVSRPYMIGHKRNFGIDSLNTTGGPPIVYYRLADAYGGPNDCDFLYRGECAGTEDKPKIYYSS